MNLEISEIIFFGQPGLTGSEDEGRIYSSEPPNSPKDKLTRLIYGEEVELKNGIKPTYGRLLCDVYHKGKNLADYFSEYN